MLVGIDMGAHETGTKTPDGTRALETPENSHLTQDRHRTLSAVQRVCVWELPDEE